MTKEKLNFVNTPQEVELDNSFDEKPSSSFSLEEILKKVQDGKTHDVEIPQDDSNVNKAKEFESFKKGKHFCLYCYLLNLLLFTWIVSSLLTRR